MSDSGIPTKHANVDLCVAPLFTANELPTPSATERRPPAAPGPGEQALFEA